LNRDLAEKEPALRELFRRMIFIGCVLTAGGLFYVASLAPLISLRYVDFAGDLDADRSAYRALKDMSRDEGGYTQQKLSEIYDGLSAASVEKYAAEKIGGDKVINLEGEQWESLARNIMDVSLEKNKDRRWTKRFPSEQHHSGDLFFEEKEIPVNFLKAYFEKGFNPLYLAVKLDSGLYYFKASYHQYSKGQFSVFGLSASPKPPSSFFYPHRRSALFILLFGLAFYAFLPRANAGKGVIFYRLPVIILGDLAALICTAFFYMLPFVIVGGFTEAFAEAYPLMILFWINCVIGLYLFKVTAFFAAYRMEILEDRIKLSALNGKAEFRFNEISFFQPVIFRPPKWLVVMMWIAALSGRGASRMGGVGRAVMLENSEYGSLCLKLENGGALYINITNAMGGVVLKGSEALPEALRKAGVEEKKDAQVIRSLGLETLKIPHGEDG
jgi:hypothetical protein